MGNYQFHAKFSSDPFGIGESGQGPASSLVRLEVAMDQHGVETFGECYRRPNSSFRWKISHSADKLQQQQQQQNSNELNCLFLW